MRAGTVYTIRRIYAHPGTHVIISIRINCAFYEKSKNQYTLKYINSGEIANFASKTKIISS